jgi:hypothetical protein
MCLPAIWVYEAQDLVGVMSKSHKTVILVNLGVFPNLPFFAKVLLLAELTRGFGEVVWITPPPFGSFQLIRSFGPKTTSILGRTGLALALMSVGVHGPRPHPP